MKAFLIALTAVVVIAVGAGVTLTQMNQSTGEAYATGSVRLNATSDSQGE